MTINQAPAQQTDARTNDLKAKLERYKRERDELDKIRTKISSKSQERSGTNFKGDNSTSFLQTGMHPMDKENGSTFGKLNQTLNSEMFSDSRMY